MSFDRRYIVLWMVLVMVLAPVVQADSSCDFRFSNYARAVQLHDMGDYDKAIQHYHCALENDPDNAIIPVLIANVYEDIASASSAWSADSACDFSFSNYARAVQLHDMGENDKAMRHYDCALENDPDDAIIPVF